MSDFELVGQFHGKFGLPRSGFKGHGPRMIDNEAFLFRYQFLHEELQEMLKSHRERDLAGIADALVDLVYVALGTAHFYGIPFDRVFSEVHTANMAKVRSEGSSDSRSKRGSGLDVVKPEGWVPPDVKRIIESYSIEVTEEEIGE